MAKYYYNKYQINYSYSNFRNPDSSFSYVRTSNWKSLSSGSTIYYSGTSNYVFNYSSNYPGFWQSGDNLVLTYDSIYNGNTRIRYMDESQHSCMVRYKIIDEYKSGDLVYWREEISKKRCQYDTFSYRGTLITTIIAEDGTYPSNGISNGYWYVKGALVFPEFKIKINNKLKTSNDGWVNVDGTLKHISSILTKVNETLKKI
ncbi:hypothetical protein PV797_03365 [Clostridiaceae bacterium M8S5]|nr:hypothetical protein PV797_03365 [Clostridiaceae bacterium M8S5]